MEGWWCQVAGQPDSVAIFLPWSVEGQCVNSNGLWLPGRLDQNLSVESGSVFLSVKRDELPICELRPEPVVMGCGWGRTVWDREQIDYGSVLYPTQRDHGLMKEEEGVLGVSDETLHHSTDSLTHTHTQTLWTHKSSSWC